MRYMKKIEVVNAVQWDGSRQAFAQIQAFIGQRAFVNWQKVPARLTIDGQIVSATDYVLVHPDGRVSILNAAAFPMLYEVDKGQSASFMVPASASNPTECGDIASIRRLVDQVLAEKSEDMQKINIATHGGITVDAVEKMVSDAVKKAAEGQTVIQVLSVDDVRKIVQDEIATTPRKRGPKGGK